MRYNASLKQVTVIGTSGSKAAATMRIFNAEGRVVITGTFISTLSTASLAQGVYIVDVAAGGRHERIRFIIGR